MHDFANFGDRGSCAISHIRGKWVARDFANPGKILFTELPAIGVAETLLRNMET